MFIEKEIKSFIFRPNLLSLSFLNEQVGQGLVIFQPSVIEFSLSLNSQEAKVAAPLSPTLGQFGINCLDFCHRFNDQTKVFNLGIPLRIRFKVLPDRKFNFDILHVDFGKAIYSSIINLLILEDRKISILDVYKLVLIFSSIYKCTFLFGLKIIFGVLRSKGVFRILLGVSDCFC